MADETKAPQIENPEKITVKDLAEMVSHHTPRHTAESPITPAVAAFRAVSVQCTRGRNGNMLVEFDGVGKCVILGRLLRKIKKYPKIKDKNFGNTKIMRIFAA